MNSSTFCRNDTTDTNNTTVAEKDVHFIQMQNVVHGLADRLNQKDTEVFV
jgi:hypothetical protein